MSKIGDFEAALAGEPFGLSPADKDTMEPRIIRFYEAAHAIAPLLIEVVGLLHSHSTLLGEVLDSTCYELDEGQRELDEAVQAILRELDKD